VVDDAIIGVGSKSKVIYAAFEPLLRRILYIWVCDVANMLTSLAFLKKIRAIYGSNIVVLSDGAHYCKASCRILKLKHELYSLEVRTNGGNNTVC